MHSKSEHTINGKRYDFELHVVHFANQTKNGVIASAVGIIFDVVDYDKSVSQDQIIIIDRFFDSLLLDNLTDPVATEIPFGQLMNLVDTNNRWAYKGSLTTPPCSKTIYFNVLTKVYPIKYHHVNFFRKHLNKTKGLMQSGNWRAVQPIETQDVKLITNFVKEIKSDYYPLLVALIVLVVIMIVGIAIVGYIIVLNSQEKQKTEVYREKPQGSGQKPRDSHEGGNEEPNVDVPNRTSRLAATEEESGQESARVYETNQSEDNSVGYRG